MTHPWALTVKSRRPANYDALHAELRRSVERKKSKQTRKRIRSAAFVRTGEVVS